MPDSNPLDVEIEIDLGLEADEETPKVELQADSPVESAEKEPTGDESTSAKPQDNEEPKAVVSNPAEGDDDDIAAALQAAIEELGPPPEEETSEASAEEASEEASEEVPEATPEEAPVAPPIELPELDISDASALDFRKVGISAWKVKVKIGLVYDFSDIKTLRKYISDGRVTNEDVISHDGKTWTALGDIPDLDNHFIEVYRQTLAANPDLLLAMTQPLDEEDELSEEAEELTNSILQQINQEVESAPIPDPIGPEFSDPFQALKEAQKSRGTHRKNQARARKRHKAEENHYARLGIVLLVLLGIIVFILNPFGSKEESSSSTATSNTTATTTNPPANSTSNTPGVPAPSFNETEKKSQERIQALVDEKKKALKRAEAEEAQTPPQRRVVVPDEVVAASKANDGSAGVLAMPKAPASQRAKRAYKKGNYAEAAKAYKEAIDAAPKPTPALHLGYGKSLFRTGSNPKAAERHLKKAEKAGKADPEAYGFLIQLLTQRGDAAGAESYRRKMIR